VLALPPVLGGASLPVDSVPVPVASLAVVSRRLAPGVTRELDSLESFPWGVEAAAAVVVVVGTMLFVVAVVASSSFIIGRLVGHLVGCAACIGSTGH